MRKGAVRLPGQRKRRKLKSLNDEEAKKNYHVLMTTWKKTKLDEAKKRGRGRVDEEDTSRRTRREDTSRRTLRGGGGHVEEEKEEEEEEEEEEEKEVS